MIKYYIQSISPKLNSFRKFYFYYYSYYYYYYFEFKDIESSRKLIIINHIISIVPMRAMCEKEVFIIHKPLPEHLAFSQVIYQKKKKGGIYKVLLVKLYESIFLIYDRNSNLNSHILIFEDAGD
jgi:hypothetical protein